MIQRACRSPWLLGLALALAPPPLWGQSTAPIAVPDRPLIEPRTVESPRNPNARAVPLEDLAVTRRVSSAAWSADGRTVFMATNITGRFNIWKVDATGGWPVQLTQSDDSQSGLTVTPDGRTLLFTQDVGGNEFPDVYAVPTAGGPVRNLTRTPDQREQELVVSPDGRQAAMAIKTKMQAQVSLALLDLATGRQRTLIAERDPEYRWQPIAWVEGGRALVANRANADQTESAVFRVDATTGRTRPIVRPRAGVYAEASDASEDGRVIALTSNEGTGQARAGWIEGGRTRWVTATPWEQISGDIARDGRTMLVRTNIDGRSTIARADLPSGTLTPLPLPAGLNNAFSEGFSPDGRTVLVSHAGADTPADLYIADLTGGVPRPLTRLAMASLNPVDLPKSVIVTFRSFDGTPVSAILTIPFNLRRDGNAPAVVLPHGGPTGQSQDGFSVAASALASRGYLVIQPNVRGSTGYGLPFQTANRNDLGGGDLRDVLAAKDFLVATGYVDAKRVGITGGSYGGFMTLMALGKAPDAFAAGVQLFGIINWRTMYTTADPLLRQYIVSLIGEPGRNAAVYDATSPLTYARAIKAPLLSLQGENDIRVPRGQAEEVAALLRERGVPNETIFYAAEGHGFQKRENQIDSLRRTVAWFDRYLK